MVYTSLCLLLNMACFFGIGVRATFKLSLSVGNMMVIQRDVPTTSLWGFATAGTVITTTLGATGVSYKVN